MYKEPPLEKLQLHTLKSMEFFSFFLRKKSHQLHALLEPPRLLISEKPARTTVLCVTKYFKNPQLHVLLEPPRLFDFGISSYLCTRC